MRREDRDMKHAFLIPMGLSTVEILVAEELISNPKVNESEYDWRDVFSIMRQQLGNNNKPQRIIQCHMACAARGPRTYGTLAELVFSEAQRDHSISWGFSPFMQYSMIGMLKAGSLLQEAHQCLIGNRFEERLATFIRAAAFSQSRVPPWDTEKGGALDLLDAAMKGYFRPQDHIARAALAAKVPGMLSVLQESCESWMTQVDSGLSRDMAMGPGAEMLRSFMFALLDVERRSMVRLLDFAQVLFPFKS